MALPGLVLVHGGLHAADCWDLVIAELASQAPELPVLAVDLPGRRSKPADLRGGRLADWVDSVVADVHAAGFGDVIVVGHSIAGLTVPDVIAKLGAERVREMILVAAVIPPQGSSALRRLPTPLMLVTQLTALIGRPVYLPGVVARFAFWNGMTREQRSLALSKLYPESSKILVQPVDRTDMPNEVPRTWIMTLRDRTLSTRRQYECIRELGGVDMLICVDTCHDVMLSEPERLAAILIERCSSRTGSQ